MSFLISSVATLGCLLAPIGDAEVPVGTLPTVSIPLPDNIAAGLIRSRADGAELPLGQYAFQDEDARRELILVARSDNGPDTFRLTRISKKEAGGNQPVSEKGALSWLDFRFGEGRWDKDTESFDFAAEYEGICKLVGNVAPAQGTSE